MRLSRTIAYAIHAVLQLGKAPPGLRMSRTQLAATAHLPERFLLEVLHSLVAGGIVRSTRGVDGGFSLTRPVDEITLNDHELESARWLTREELLSLGESDDFRMPRADSISRQLIAAWLEQPAA